MATPVNVGQIQALRCLTVTGNGLLAQLAIHHYAHQMPAGEWRIGVDCQAQHALIAADCFVIGRAGNFQYPIIATGRLAAITPVVLRVTVLRRGGGRWWLHRIGGAQLDGFGIWVRPVGIDGIAVGVLPGIDLGEHGQAHHGEQRAKRQWQINTRHDQ